MHFGLSAKVWPGAAVAGLRATYHGVCANSIGEFTVFLAIGRQTVPTSVRRGAASYNVTDGTTLKRPQSSNHRRRLCGTERGQVACRCACPSDAAGPQEPSHLSAVVVPGASLGDRKS